MRTMKKRRRRMVPVRRDHAEIGVVFADEDVKDVLGTLRIEVRGESIPRLMHCLFTPQFIESKD